MMITGIDHYSSVANVGGEFVTIFLIIVTIISLLLAYTKDWNMYNSDTIDSCLYPALITFVGIAIFKAILVL